MAKKIKKRIKRKPIWKVKVVPRDDSGVCEPADIIKTLDDNKALPNFIDEYGKPSLDGLGDCREVSPALLADLIVAGYGNECALVSGYYKQGVVCIHYWVRFRDWAIDATQGHKKPVIIMDSNEYEEHYSDIQVVTGKEFYDRLREGDSSFLDRPNKPQ